VKLARLQRTKIKREILMVEIIRFGVSIDERLLDKFDNLMTTTTGKGLL
jgi:hypothetical protein